MSTNILIVAPCISSNYLISIPTDAVYCEGLYVFGVFFLKLILFILPCIQGSLNFIIYFYFPILNELICISYCFISISNNLLLVKCYSSLVVSGLSRNEFNPYILFNFCCLFIYFYLMIRLRGISSLFLFYNFLFNLVLWILL